MRGEDMEELYIETEINKFETKICCLQLSQW